MTLIKDKKVNRLKRKRGVRKKIWGSPERPRLTVFKTARHMYAQIIDDSKAITLLSASTISKDIRPKAKGIGGNIKGAKLIGEILGKQGKEKGIEEVVFDRNGFLYHGRIKALAEAARENGLRF